jgi:hypothetical protein
MMSEKVFSLKPIKETKPVKGAGFRNSKAEVLDNGDLTITDNFSQSAFSVEEALKSAEMYKNPEKYASELRKILKIDSRVKDLIKFMPEEKNK